ncbi:hypothetical protein QBC37DRAFT_370426 [Rhypophila decipiens]|uniref:Uncharacterized protein n=1 Tax=Rhypophila decipiens TaxID=261697 RepID=A0AAN6YIW9_9PEZI|nr:hypothetical protein QBC37DRAFT_370426 [Rhypophila decipiens]
MSPDDFFLVGPRARVVTALGMSIMMYYIVYIMATAKIASPLATASIQYIINVVITLPAIIFLDK